MPDLAAADFNFVVSSDLYGLGARDSDPIPYHWAPPSWLTSPPSQITGLLAWFGVLGLLLLRMNRQPGSWWIGGPLIFAVAGVHFILGQRMDASGNAEMFAGIYNALAFGLAAVWLLAPVLQHRSRFVALVKTALACWLAAGVAFAVQTSRKEVMEIVGTVVVVGIPTVVLIVGLWLGSLMCRRSYRPARLSLWTLVYANVLLFVGVGPFSVMAILNNGRWRELNLIFVCASAAFAVLLPFLLLAFASELYRQRLKDLLHLQPEPESTIPPVLPQSSPPPSEKTTP